VIGPRESVLALRALVFGVYDRLTSAPPQGASRGGIMTGRSLSSTVVAAFALAALMAVPARAEVSEIRLAKQFSMGYVQFNILQHRGLIEQHAKALGLGDIKVV
jgi:hypothetical protein